MAPAKQYRASSFAITVVFGVSLLASGCCGPMACGPVGCGSGHGGPVVFGGCGGGSCGGGCDGCGETYIDEWINHPPSCDNCDSCGNHNGQTCSSCRPIFDGFKSLWGYRRDGGCDSGCSTGSCGCESGSSGCESGSTCDGGCEGCSSCGGGNQFASSETGHHYVDSTNAIPMPHQQSQRPQLVLAQPAVKAFQPQRTKQIFRPKNTVAGNTSPRSGF